MAHVKATVAPVATVSGVCEKKLLFTVMVVLCPPPPPPPPYGDVELPHPAARTSPATKPTTFDRIEPPKGVRGNGGGLLLRTDITLRNVERAPGGFSWGPLLSGRFVPQGWGGAVTARG